MPAPLSIDLRTRVISAVERGMRKTEAAKVFNVSRKVIYNWFGLKESTNSLEPKSGYQKGHSHKITDFDQFKAFVENNTHRTVKGMIIEWKKLTNIDVSESAMERYLKKINFTSKKKLLITSKQNKKSAKYF